MTPPKPSIVIAGSIAQQPHLGGLTWVFLQYVLGFRRLGWDVLFVDRIAPEWCVDAIGRPAPVEVSSNLHYFRDVFERAALTQHVSLLGDDGQAVLGLPRYKVLRRLRDATVLLNINGFLVDGELLAAARHRVFLDIDPGFLQFWRQQGLANVFAGHHDFVTIGENIGQPDCAIPTCGLTWITTPQPVVLSEWPRHDGGEVYTSVVSWRGLFGPLEHQGRRLGLRVHEFRKLIELPRRTGARFELALDIGAADERDRVLLQECGWRIVPPRDVAGDPWSYRRFIQSSKAEFSVAKEAYVATQSGWLSDRSLCYLASGKPVIAQETGFSRNYPATSGLLSYATLDEAVERVRQVEANYAKHATAAREMAEEFFDSDRVLTRLLGKLGINTESARRTTTTSDRATASTSAANDTASPMTEGTIRRLNWGCGAAGELGWINSDRKAGPNIDLPCDILAGLSLADDSIDYAVSVHALQEIPLDSIVPVLAELRRVLRPSGVLRLVLPDLERGMAAFANGARDYFLVPDEDARTLGGKFITQMLWYGYSRTLFTHDFTAELLERAGFRTVRRCEFRQTASGFAGIVELDNRERESLFMEAVK